MMRAIRSTTGDCSGPFNVPLQPRGASVYTPIVVKVEGNNHPEIDFKTGIDDL